MAKKILHIIETAYRATIEEQDDPVLWISHAMKGAGAHLAVLLRGEAVNYAVKGQDASGLSFGAKKQTQPPRLERDISSLIDKGVDVQIVEDDVAKMGLEKSDLIPAVKGVKEAGIPSLMNNFDLVWHW